MKAKLASTIVNGIALVLATSVLLMILVVCSLRLESSRDPIASNSRTRIIDAIVMHSGDVVAVCASSTSESIVWALSSGKKRELYRSTDRLSIYDDFVNTVLLCDFAAGRPAKFIVLRWTNGTWDVSELDLDQSHSEYPVGLLTEEILCTESFSVLATHLPSLGLAAHTGLRSLWGANSGSFLLPQVIQDPRRCTKVPPGFNHFYLLHKKPDGLDALSLCDLDGNILGTTVVPIEWGDVYTIWANERNGLALILHGSPGAVSLSELNLYERPATIRPLKKIGPDTVKLEFVGLFAFSLNTGGELSMRRIDHRAGDESVTFPVIAPLIVPERQFDSVMSDSRGFVLLRRGIDRLDLWEVNWPGTKLRTDIDVDDTRRSVADITQTPDTID